MFFSQLKHYLKLNKKVLKFDELNEEVKQAIKKVSKDNYKNYFQIRVQEKGIRKINQNISTLIRKTKNYK